MHASLGMGADFGNANVHVQFVCRGIHFFSQSLKPRIQVARKPNGRLFHVLSENKRFDAPL